VTEKLIEGCFRVGKNRRRQNDAIVRSPYTGEPGSRTPRTSQKACAGREGGQFTKAGTRRISRLGIQEDEEELSRRKRSIIIEETVEEGWGSEKGRETGRKPHMQVAGDAAEPKHAK